MNAKERVGWAVVCCVLIGVGISCRALADELRVVGRQTKAAAEEQAKALADERAALERAEDEIGDVRMRLDLARSVADFGHHALRACVEELEARGVDGGGPMPPRMVGDGL
jgi:hypothetical protein